MHRTPAPRLVVALAAALSLPAGLEAQTDPIMLRDFGVRCTPGALRACLSVVAWNELDATTGEYNLYVRMANVQGSAGYADLRAFGLSWWGLDNLSLHYPAGGGQLPGLDAYPLYERVTDHSPRGAEAGPGGVFECAGPGGGCTELAEGETGTAGGFHWISGNAPGPLGLTSNLAQDGGLLWGCGIAEEPAGEQYWGVYHSTCGGHVTFRVSLGFGTGLALTDQTTIGMGFQTNDAAGSVEFASCSGANCTAVVPEPITMVLLGSGLLGIGGAGAARRRRRSDGLEEA